MEEISEALKTKLDEVIKDKNPKEIVVDLLAELEKKNVTVVQLLKYAEGIPRNLPTLSANVINNLGRAVSKLQDPEQKKLRGRFYKLAADAESPVGCINYAKFIKSQDVAAAAYYAKQAIKFTKSGEKRKEYEDFLANLQIDEILEVEDDKKYQDALAEIQAGIAKVDINAVPPGLYKSKTVNMVRKQEVEVQKYAHDRFFRINKGPRHDSNSHILYNLLLALEKKSTSEVLPTKIQTLKEDVTKYRPLKGNAQAVCAWYVKNSIVLDERCSRSVVIALSWFLNQHGYIPTAVYTIGNTHVLCQSNPSASSKGNIFLQTVTQAGETQRNPSVYGDGNGKPQNSIFEQLKKVIDANPTEKIPELLRNASRKIVSLANFDEGECNGFLDKVNFLRVVIEVARYCYRKGEQKDLDGLPVGVSQQRASQLFIEGDVKLHQVYGMDVAIYPPGSPHKSPFCVVAGTDLKKNVSEVENKTHRINRQYNKRYVLFAQQLQDEISSDESKDKALPKPSPVEFDHALIEGPSLLKRNLKDEFGSGDESNSSDYSDHEAASFLKSFEKTKFGK